MTPEILYALRDPAGVPTHPWLFLILGALTLALHMAAVQVMLGTGLLTLRGAYSKNPYWRRLAAHMLITAKIAVSVAIVIGVAPLLFVQVVYDPFWYTSNVLSAWWVIGFILILIAGYIALYIFYWKNHHLETEGGRSGHWLVLSLALLLGVGYIVHALTNQMLFPEEWLAWYAPDGIIQPDGQRLHYAYPLRFGFFIALSLPVTGAWLLGYRRFQQGRADADPVYIAWLKPLALGLLVVGGLLAVVLGALWMLTLPEKMAWFAASPWVYVALGALLITVALPLALGRTLDQGYWGYATFGLGAVALIVVCAVREVLRYFTLTGSHGYDALDYSVHMDWYSLVLFLLTFAVLGGVTLGYMLTVAWQAGQTVGRYSPSPALSRLGSLSIGLLVLWTLAYFGIGFYVWAN